MQSPVKIKVLLAVGALASAIGGCSQDLSTNDSQNIGSKIQICPEELSEDVVRTLGLSKSVPITKSFLVSKWRDMGFVVQDSPYHIVDSKCSEVSLTGENVTQVTVGWLNNETIFKRYVVHFDEQWRIAKIEARYHGGRFIR